MGSSSILSFHENGQIGKDTYDGMLLQPLSESYLQIGIGDPQNGEYYSINSVPVESNGLWSFPLYLTGKGTGSTALLSIEGTDIVENDWKFTLRDNRTGKEQLLSKGGFAEVDLNLISENVSQNKGIQTQPQIAQAHYSLVINAGSETPVSSPNSFALHQNHPNPFNPSTIISFELPVDSEVSLKVFDALGREVARLIDGRVEAGDHQVIFEGMGLASGVYIYQLQTGNRIFTQKMSLIK